MLAPIVLITWVITGGGCQLLPPPELSRFVDEMLEMIAKVERHSVQTSVRLSKISQSLTKSVFHLADERYGGLAKLKRNLTEHSQATSLKGGARAAICLEGLKLNQMVNFNGRWEAVNKCLHNVSNSIASFEVRLTEVIIQVRSQIFEAIRAVTFCKPGSGKPDNDCVAKIVKEARLFAQSLPYYATRILKEASQFDQNRMDAIGKCLLKEKEIKKDFMRLSELVEKCGNLL